VPLRPSSGHRRTGGSQSNRNNHDAGLTWENPGSETSAGLPRPGGLAGHTGSIASPHVANQAESVAPIDRLCAAIAQAQVDDPFAPVTVVVPSPYVRVQLRREVGARTGLCNVGFRTWGELTTDLARDATPDQIRVASRRAVDEALRQVLLAGPSAFELLARSPTARSELAQLLTELWRAGPELVEQLRVAGGRALALVETLEAVEQHLLDHGFSASGRLLELAANHTVDAASIGALVRWFPPPLRGRDRRVLDRLRDAGVPVQTIDLAEGMGTIGTVIACSDPDEETRVAVRGVLDALTRGVPLWRQAIVHPPAARYRRALHQQMAAASIPMSGASSMTLDQSATGRALLGALTLAEGSWRRDEVMGWLAVAPITYGPDRPPVPLTLWDDVSARAGVIEGLAQWRTRLERFSVIGNSRDDHVAHHQFEADGALALATFVDELSERLSATPTRWSEWTRWALNLLSTYLDHRDAAWPYVELAASENLRTVIGRLAELDDISPGADLLVFRHAVESELASQPVRDEREVATPSSEGEPAPAVPDRKGLPGPLGSGVFIGTPADVRGLTFEVVHLVGAADQYLPGSPAPTPVLADSEVAHEDWPTPERRREELLDDVRTAISLSAQPVTVYWPVADPRSGREQDRSRWLDPHGRLAGLWSEEQIPSFQSDIVGPAAAEVPLAGADRLLGALARAATSGLVLTRHPAVTGADTGGAIPIVVGVEAANAPTSERFSRFEGNVGTALARDVSGELSPTRLEQYAECPRRYLFDRELYLAPPFRPEATEQMDGRDRGSLVHEILAAYIVDRIEGPAPASLDRLLEIAEERFAVADEEGRCGPPLMARVERANLLRDLRRFFEEDTLMPQAAELSFGAMGGADDVAEDRLEGDVVPAARANAVEVDLGRGHVVRFRGSVDRVDVTPNGSQVVVSDYKTGRQAGLLKQLKEDPVAGGRKLQLPIYALAARAHLDWDGPVVARYWNVSWNRDVPSLVCEIDDRVLKRFKEVVATIVAGIESGVFPGDPGEESYRYGRPVFDHCANCDFDKVCPTDRDRRWAVARIAPEVAPVLLLREPPPPDVEDLVTARPVDFLELA
jgi:ATP-dependent helicase/nuclease subunit B